MDLTGNSVSIVSILSVIMSDLNGRIGFNLIINLWLRICVVKPKSRFKFRKLNFEIFKQSNLISHVALHFTEFPRIQSLIFDFYSSVLNSPKMAVAHSVIFKRKINSRSLNAKILICVITWFKQTLSLMFKDFFD